MEVVRNPKLEFSFSYLLCEELLSGPVSFLTLHYAAVLNAIFSKAGKFFPQLYMSLVIRVIRWECPKVLKQNQLHKMLSAQYEKSP